jgi:hypothetical protein
MGVIGAEAFELFRVVRDKYPETYEWAKHKAHWEGMPLLGVFANYYEYITEELMPTEAELDCKHRTNRHQNESGEDVIYCDVTARWMNVTLGECLGNCGMQETRDEDG